MQLIIVKALKDKYLKGQLASRVRTQLLNLVRPFHNIFIITNKSFYRWGSHLVAVLIRVNISDILTSEGGWQPDKNLNPR